MTTAPKAGRNELVTGAAGRNRKRKDADENTAPAAQPAKMSFVNVASRVDCGLKRAPLRQASQLQTGKQTENKPVKDFAAPLKRPRSNVAKADLAVKQVGRVLNDSLKKPEAGLKDVRTVRAKLHEVELQLADTVKERESVQRQYESTLAMLKESQERESEISSYLAVVREQYLALQKETEVQITRAAALQAQLEQANAVIYTMQEKSMNDAKLRRELHNQILELKGNIRVFGRVRPLLSGEEGGSCFSFPPNDPDKRSIEIQGEKEKTVDSCGELQKQWRFDFDRVFRQEEDQAMVFEEVAPVIQSALDGYRVCVFAYGQTGSGKSFTMEGNLVNPQLEGLIPRAARQIFAEKAIMAAQGWHIRIVVSYLEIYNEQIRDLLEKPGPAQPPSTNKRRASDSYQIRHSRAGDSTIVTDLTEIEVVDPAHMLSLLQSSFALRAVAKTSSNDKSSRSHSVLQLRVTGENDISKERREGLLSLVDLAGSERLSKSEATGDRLKETQAINKSLSALGDVIFALSNKEKHVPYRNSKLTYLLQHSLGGNSKTLMLVNIFPAARDIGETLCSLRFGKKVNNCEIGTATRRAVNK